MAEVVTTFDPLAHLRIRIVVPRVFKLRFWLATQFFKLGGYAIGTECQIEIEEK